MEASGIVIFQNGTILPFGKYFCPDQKEYSIMPGHNQTFVDEIVSSFEFKLANYSYDNNDNVYKNAIKLSREGLILIFNNKQSLKSPNEILAYVPTNPTLEQLSSLKDLSILSKQQIQRIYEFCSDDIDDFIDYDNFSDYVSNKKVNIR